jgi:hypothetical protein
MAAKDRWHQLADAIGASDLPRRTSPCSGICSTRADYGTAVLPAKFTPRQADIARKTSHSRRQVRYAIRHLERHKWLDMEGRTGPGKPLTYTLAAGAMCDCTGRVHTSKRRQPKSRTAATIDNRTATTNGGNVAGQTVVRTERPREGGGERELEPKPDLALCPVCQTPMDPVLPANGYRTHPCCDPAEVPL